MAKIKGLNKDVDSRKITGSYTSPVTITAAGGITASLNTDEDIYIVSSGGAVNLTATPQISPGSWEGQTLRLIGTSNTNYITLETGAGLVLASSWDSLADQVMNLRWSAANNIWEESAGGGAAFVSEVSDAAYSGSWDGVTTLAPSKNAVYDKIESLASKVRPIMFTIDAGTSVISTGTKKYVFVPYACTINDWVIGSNTSGSIVIDVKTCLYGSLPTTTSIAGSELPTLSSQQENRNTTISTWNKTVVAGTWFEFVVNSVTGLTWVHICMKVTLP